MAEFEPAVAVVLKHEGGYVNNPNDPGGETNFGISKRFLSQHALPGWDVSIKDMTVEFARDCYLKCFWQPQNYSKIADQTVATKVFDAAVNMGPQQANRLLQQALGKLGFGGIVPDGFVGSQTIEFTNKASPDRLIQQLCEGFAEFYQGLAKKNPKLAEFLPNWLHRAGWRG
jgi:lysozyme family protein